MGVVFKHRAAAGDVVHNIVGGQAVLPDIFEGVDIDAGELLGLVYIAVVVVDRAAALLSIRHNHIAASQLQQLDRLTVHLAKQDATDTAGEEADGGLGRAFRVLRGRGGVSFC